MVAFTVFCDVTAGSEGLTVVDFCGIFDLAITTGADKSPWLERSLGINFLLILSTDEGRLGSCILPIGEVALKDCAVGMLVLGR